MNKTKHLLIILLALFGFSLGAWAIEQDTDGYYLIGSVQDWDDFAALVQTTPTANAKMIADVDLGDDQTHIGSTAQNGTTYKGTFDGQGYTLTVAYVGGSRQIVAPFTNVEAATIKNLHVAGSISSVFAFIGVVGYVRGWGSTTTVSNVWMSATMSIQTGEWAQSGAIVGGFNNGSVVVSDCLFTGSFTSNQGGYCGCFVGYNYSAGTITQTNCLSTGTFNMSGTGFRGEHSNCYVSSFPASFPSGVEEATATGLSDGTIAEALGDAWVQDPGTGQPMLKIFTTLRQDEDGYYLIGSVTDWRRFAAIVEATPTANGKMIRDVDLGVDQTTVGDPNENPSHHYKGIFDGQAHTLTVHYVTQGSKDIRSPFPNISEATIKNIHITGTIESSTACQPAAIGCVRYGTSTIEKVWSSVELISTKSSWCEASGLVGCVDGYKGGHLVMTNCMVSGNIKSSGSYEGCFIGYINSGGSATVSNCLSVANFEYSGTSGFMGNYTNCYVLQFPSSIPSHMRITDEQLTDGTTATALQADSEEEVWVQDPVLGTPMLKIFASEIMYTLPLSGVGTFSAKGQVLLPEGLSAHYCTVYHENNSTISVMNISNNIVPAATGVLLSGTPGETFTLTGTCGQAPTITGNALVAVTESKHIPATDGDYTNFMMKGGNFVKIDDEGSDVMMPAHRAYLPLLASMIAGAKTISIVWDNVTDITSPLQENGDMSQQRGDNTYYNLQGQRVYKPTRGIYIKNGNKVLIK